MSDDAEHVDDEERGEAQALADALDARASAATPPEDALATAMLLRHGGPQAELDAERGEAILQRLLREPAAARRVRSVRVRPWAVGLLAAAVILLGLVALRARNEQAAPRALLRANDQLALPRVSATLLAAQAQLTKANAEDRARFEHEMHAYRVELFRTLQAAYPAALSVLEPSAQRRR
jgi:hypothetical protein